MVNTNRFFLILFFHFKLLFVAVNVAAAVVDAGAIDVLALSEGVKCQNANVV